MSPPKNSKENLAKSVWARRFLLVLVGLAFASIFLWYLEGNNTTSGLLPPRDDWTKIIHSGGHRKAYPQLVYAANHSVVICLVPKVASTVMLMMAKRMNGVPNWSSTSMPEIRGETHWEPVKEADINNPKITRMAMVRNPVNRLLSGYLNKIVHIRSYKLLPKGKWTDDRDAEPPTFQQFVDILDSVPFHTVNKHFRPQSMLCHTEKVPFTSVLDFEDRENAMRGFLKSIDLWEDIGASGWGPNGTSAIFAEKENITTKGGSVRPSTVSKNPTDIVREYYTPELLKQVFRMYDMDYKAFQELGWSKDVNAYL